MDLQGSMNSSANNVVNRRARPDDYQAVMDMSLNHYDGMDYLPYLYYTYLQRNKHAVYVTEKDGLVVSFVIVELSQENSVATMMAVRTRRSHQGQGLSVSKNKALRSLILAEHPTIKKEAWSMQLENGNEGLRKQSERLFHRRKVTASICMKAVSEHVINYKTEQNHKILSYIEAVKLLRESNCFEDFFSQLSLDYITADENSRILKVNKEELQQLFAANCLCVTFADEESESSIIDISKNLDIPLEFARNSRKIIALSYNYMFLMNSAIEADMRYFGDLSKMADHVAIHLRYIYERSENNDTINLFAAFPATISSDDFGKVIEKLGITVKDGNVSVVFAETCSVIKSYAV